MGNAHGPVDHVGGRSGVCGRHTDRRPDFVPGDEVLALIGLPLVLGGAAGLWCLRRASRVRVLGAFTLGAIGFLVALFGFGTARVDRHQNARPLVAEIRQACPGDFQLAGFQLLPKTFVYYAARPVTYCDTAEDLRAFLDRAEHPYVIAHGDQVDELEPRTAGPPDRVRPAAAIPPPRRRGDPLRAVAIRSGEPNHPLGKRRRRPAGNKDCAGSDRVQPGVARICRVL